ncbi:hypothetical protein HAZT_HAZT004245 [Hyalella azteca]|nr:hypothetical protein HAZT_HAZT004245 [Hyalella azteca]
MRRVLDSGRVHVDCTDRDGGTALIVSSQCGHSDVVELLLARGADPNTAMRDRATALFVAAQNGHTAVVRSLLRGGARIDARRADGATSLWIAAQMGHAQVVRELLGHGAQPDTPRKDGATALFKAAHKGHVDVVKALLLHRPKLGLLKNGESALHAAALYGHIEVARLLLRAGADPTLRNDQGLTAAHIALRAGHLNAAKLLQQPPPSPKRSPLSPRGTPTGTLSRGSSQPGSLETIVEASPPPQRANNFQSCELTALMDGETRARINQVGCSSLSASNNSLTAPSPSPSVVSEPPAPLHPPLPHHRATSHADLRSMKSLFCKTFSSFRRASLGRRVINAPP